MENQRSNITRLLVSSGAIVFIGILLQLGLNFVTKIILARLLGRSGYGVVTLGLTIMTTASILTLIGLDTGISRFLPRFDQRDRRRGVLISAFKIAVPLSTASGVLIALFADVIASEVFGDASLTSVIMVFGLVIPLSSLVRLAVGSARGLKESLPRVYMQNIGLPLLQLLAIVAVLLMGFRSIGVAWSYLFAHAIVALLAIYYLIKKTPLVDTVSPTPMYRHLLLFSAPLMITAAMNLILANIDVFMIGIFDSTEEVGIYNSVYPLARLLNIVLVAFGYIFIPLISELHSEGKFEKMNQGYLMVSKWVLFATLPLALVLVIYPGVIIRNTFGAEYTGGSLALSVLAIGFFTHAIFGPTGDTLTSIGETRLIMYDNIVVAGFNVVLNVLLIPRYSFLGAAVATAAGYALMNTLYMIQLYRQLGMHPFRATLALPIAAATGYWVSTYFVINNFYFVDIVSVIISSVIFIPLYITVILFSGSISSEEIDLAAEFAAEFGLSSERVEMVKQAIKNRL